MTLSRWVMRETSGMKRAPYRSMALFLLLLASNMRSAASEQVFVLDEFLRPLRLRSAAEIRGRANHRHPHIRPDAYGNHVFRHLLAAAHAGVVLLSHDVGEAIVDGDFDFDVRVFSQ